MSENGPGAKLRSLCDRFDRLLSLDHRALREQSEQYDEAYHSAVHALKDLRQFAEIVAPTWAGAAQQATITCPDCSGTGTYLYATDAPGRCPTCKGAGRVESIEYYGDDTEAAQATASSKQRKQSAEKREEIPAARSKTVAAVSPASIERVRVHGVVWVLLSDDHDYVVLERCEKKKRVLGVGEWFLPGGKIEAIDESQIDDATTALHALERELREEWPDVQLTSARELPIVEGSPVPAGPRGLFLMRPYLIRVQDVSKVPTASSEGTPLQWYPIDGRFALYSPVAQVRMMIAAAMGAQ